MTWWTWIIAGFVVLMIELFIPTGFFLFFIGAAGIFTGVLTYFGVLPWPLLQWAVCAVTAVALAVTIRSKVAGLWSAGDSKQVGTIAGEDVELKEDILPAKTGRGDLRGSQWTVKNDGVLIAKAGERYKVESVDGFTLRIKVG